MMHRVNFKKLGLGILFTSFFSHTSMAATCSASNDPLIITADCTRLIINSDKTVVTVNNGVNIYDEHAHHRY